MAGGGSGVGFYMADKRIYLVELRKEFGGIQVVRYAEAEVELTENNLPKEFSSQTVRQAFEKAGIKSENVIVALAEKESMTRYFDMPLLPKKEWKNSVRFEAQKYLPFDVRDLYSDFKVIPDKTKKRMSVMFLAAKRHAADLILEFIHQAGLSVSSMESVSVSFVRLLYSQQPWKITDVFGVLDIGEEGNLNIAIIKGNKLLMTRNCFFTISQGSAPSANFESFTGEVRLSLNYFMKNFKDEKIQYLIFCGDTERNFPQWDESLGNELEISVKKFYPTKIFGKSLPYSSGLAAAIGAALKPLASDNTPHFNLIPPEKAKRFSALPMSQEQENSLLKKTLITGGIVVLIVLIALKISLTIVALSRTQTINEIKKPFINEAGGLAYLTKDQLEEKKTEFGNKLQFFDSLVGRRVFWTSKMNEIAKLLPDNMSLLTLDYTDNEDRDGQSTQSLTIEGTVFSDPGAELSAVNSFVMALGKSEEFMKGFEEIKISSIQKNFMENLTTTKFTIVCLPHAIKQNNSP